MGDGDRAAVLNLLLKQRNHTAVAAQNVAEPHRHALHGGVLGKGLDQHFADALGAAHNIGGVDRLIGGELDKALHPMVGGAGQQVFGAKHIVLDGLGRADLHQGHMLVGGGVEHHRRVIGFKHLIQALDVPDGPDQRHNGRIGAVLVAQLHLQLIGTVLINVKDEKLPGPVAHDLAAELAADGPAAAGDENNFIVKILGNLDIVELDLVPGKEVRGVELTQAGHHGLAAGIHRLGIGEHPNAAMGGIAEVDYLLQTLPLEGGNGDDDFHNVIFSDQLRDVRDGSAHRNALNPKALLGQVIVHDDHRVAEGCVFAFAEVDGPGPRIARAHNEQRGRVTGCGVIFMRSCGLCAHSGKGAQKPPQEPHPGNGRRVEHRADDQHRAADRAGAEQQIKQQDKAGGQARKAGQAGKVPHTGILPHNFIQTAEPEHHHIDDEHIGQHGRHGADDLCAQGLHRDFGIRAIKAQQNCQIIAQHNQAAVQQHQQNTPGQALDDLSFFLFHSRSSCLFPVPFPQCIRAGKRRGREPFYLL